jgi:hypothetical protein
MICRIPSNSVHRVLFTLLFCGLFADLANAQEPDPRELLKRMSDEIAGLQSYIINGDAYSDARLDGGLIIEHASQATLRIRKPDLVRITNRTSEDTKDLFFDSSVLTVYTQSKNLYGQTEIPGGAKAALDYAVNDMGIDLPMLDFVSGNVAETLLANATDVMYLGTSLIRGSVYEHIVIRTPDIDIQLWIATEGPPLPGKMSLSAKWDGGSPRTVVFMDWNITPDFPNHALQFEPPEGAIKIKFETQHASEE